MAMAQHPEKVWSWQGWRGGTTREIVAARSMAEVRRITGLTPAYLFNLTETGNARELEVALAEPGVVFWRPVDDRSGNYHREDS